MDSPIDLNIVLPSQILKPQVHSILVMEATEGSMTDWEKVVPYGQGALVFHYADPYSIKYQPEGPVEELPPVFSAGLTLKPLWIKPSGVTRTIIVNLHPSTLWKMLKIDMKAQDGRIIDLHPFYSDALTECLYRLKESQSDSGKAFIIENFLIETAKLPEFEVDIVDTAIEKIDQADGIININLLSQSLNVSVSKLERHFRKKIGMTPKTYSSIFRFNKVFRFMNENPGIDIHDVLYLCGYYDQPHFIRDFNRYAGETPRSFFLKANAAVDVFSGK